MRFNEKRRGKKRGFGAAWLKTNGFGILLAIPFVAATVALVFWFGATLDQAETKRGKSRTTRFVDNIPPEIIGAADVNLIVGDSYDFAANISAQDDRDANPTLEIDSSSVNFQEIGTYKVTYTARDNAYNLTVQEITVFVNPKPPPPGTNVVYLTFDDGPSAYTPELLDVLKIYNVKATFFVTGRFDGTFQRIAADGHAIGLHTNSHNYAIYSSESAFFEDLNAIGDRIENQVGFRPKILRFAGGSSNTISKNYSAGIMTRLSAAVHEQGYKYYDWNCTTGDGAGAVTAAREIENVRRCSGTIYLLAHDTYAHTIEAMRTIIPELLNRGYRFEIITFDTPEWHHQINN